MSVNPADLDSGSFEGGRGGVRTQHSREATHVMMNSRGEFCFS